MAPERIIFDTGKQILDRILFHSIVPEQSIQDFRAYSFNNNFAAAGELNHIIESTFRRHADIPYKDGAFILHGAQVFDNWGLIRLKETSQSPLFVTGFGWNREHTGHLENKGFLAKSDDAAGYNLNYELKLAERLAGRTCLLSFPGALTYGHWFFDVVGRYFSIPADLRANIDHFLLPSPWQNWMDRFLLVMGIPMRKILHLDKHNLYECDELIVPTVPSQAPGGVVSRGVMDIILQRFSRPFDFWCREFEPVLSDVVLLKHTPMTSDASRLLANLDELETTLRDAGLNTLAIDPVKMPLGATLRAIQGTKTVIGQDSSALHNLVCVPRNLIVIESEPRRNMLHTCIQVAGNRKICTLSASNQEGAWKLPSPSVLNYLKNTHA